MKEAAMADDPAVEWFCSTLVPDENFRMLNIASS
jgi:hypothetical protein